MKKYIRDRNQKAREKSGLRHFSLLVLNKVESKKKTTYKQVADELINELDKGEEDVRFFVFCFLFFFFFFLL